MRNFTKQMLVAALLLPCGMVHADDTDVVVKTKNGSAQYGIKTVKSIALGADGITINRNEATAESFGYDSIEKIYFMLVTQIAETTVADFTVSMDASGSFLTIKGAESKADINIFSMNGTRVKSIKGWNGADIRISDMPKGIYIIQVNNQALKFKK
ncbi:MAG: T9SS type A sorting domain-containing protein [Prevotella sp.]|nr:T9SS type A sorting domain-containing protein [Prevotella sp.]